MFKPLASFSGMSVKDQSETKAFYADTLGLELVDESMGLRFKLPGGGQLFLYQKSDHQPAGFTVLNFVVDDIDAAVKALTAKGVKFERYPGTHQDASGIARGKAANMGPDIAWFTDPSGNILAVLQN